MEAYAGQQVVGIDLHRRQSAPLLHRDELRSRCRQHRRDPPRWQVATRVGNSVSRNGGDSHERRQRDGWTAAEHEVRTTLILLVEGYFVVNLKDGDVEMVRQGDFASFGPGGSGTSWRAIERSVVMTVRWPSVEPPTP